MWMAGAVFRPMASTWARLVLLACFLQGCSAGGELEDAMQEYRDRLARVLDAPLPEIASRPPLDYPSPTSLRQVIPSLNLNLREFYALQECELGTLVAERNTAVGKTQQPSQRLAYETQLLASIDGCISRMADAHQQLATRLREIKSIKRDHRQHVWANLIQSSQEMHYALSMPQQLLTANDNRDARAGITSLHYLNERQTPSLFTLSELESQLQQAASARLPAKLFQTERYLTAALNPLTTALTPLLASVPCPDGRASEQAEILRNVFYLFFIEKVQPVGSRLNEYYYQVLPVFEDWADNSSLHPDFVRFIQDNAIDGFTHYQSAVRAHVKLWQDFLGRCNLSPGAPG